MGFNLLILELLTLLVCIVTFAPLSRVASNVFIFTIALTALLLLLVPLILSFISGYQGDKAKHENKRAKEKQKAVQSDMLVLETDPIRRKRYLRLPKILTLLVCPGVCLISGFVLALTKNPQELLAVQLLRAPPIQSSNTSSDLPQKQLNFSKGGYPVRIPIYRISGTVLAKYCHCFWLQDRHHDRNSRGLYPTIY